MSKELVVPNSIMSLTTSRSMTTFGSIKGAVVSGMLVCETVLNTAALLAKTAEMEAAIAYLRSLAEAQDFESERKALALAA